MKLVRHCEQSEAISRPMVGIASSAWPGNAILAMTVLGFLLAACQPAAATPTLTPIIPPSLTSTSTATAIPSATATALKLAATAVPELSDDRVPTLAPFPLTKAELQPTALSTSGISPASFPAPLALNPHDHFYFARPVADADLKSPIPSQRYGVLQEAGEIHDAHLGLDIGLNSRTPVRAAAGGTVTWAAYGLLYNSVNYIDDPYGISVVIRHDFGIDGKRLYTIYAHLSEAKVKVGDRVESGQVIALSGDTGLTTGPHLHFEVRLGGNTIYLTRNPELWIAPPENYGVLTGRVATTRDALLMNRLVEVRSLDTGKLYTMYTYATEYKLLPDDYYAENFALGDLPAGRYEVAVPYLGVWRRAEVEIKPGAVTYFHFRGLDGYSFELPADPIPENVPVN
ncbi:MAG: M23 family metallopeptidase [Anaerolineales bacterium]